MKVLDVKRKRCPTKGLHKHKKYQLYTPQATASCQSRAYPYAVGFMSYAPPLDFQAEFKVIDQIVLQINSIDSF